MEHNKNEQVKEHKPQVETHDHKQTTAVKEEVTKKVENKAESKKAPKQQIQKKEQATTYGRNIHMSKKHGMAICKMIKGKKIDEAIQDLQRVIKMKKVVPFNGEIPHRKGKGMMSGRYPIKASGLFITLLKGLKGNVIVNGMELETTVISEASANWGYRPLRSDNRKGKRTNVLIIAKEIKKNG